ncbi:uncharacterized protein [Diabrotica undecimpunctata]|uniref:uncharacterized protein n=1 Tax=Diabrotica undecimpunctata TaxID=50387 RepID=UPI003B635BC9
MAEENLREFIREIFSKDYEVTKESITSLTKPGDNFLSIMLKVEVILKKRDDGSEKKLNAVAKCVKNSNEFVKRLFPTAFKNEIRFYKEIVPTLQNFQQERGIEDILDMFPEFYGARINNNGSDEVDDTAVILLEDLKFDGYINVDRHEGFQLTRSKNYLKRYMQTTCHRLGLKNLLRLTYLRKKIRKKLYCFFLWSSVHLNVLKQNFDELLIYYHTEFTDQLRRLNCNTNLFDIDKFWEELDAVAPSNFMDIMYMTMFVVFGKKDRGDELETDEIVGVVKEDVPKAARDKIAFMVSEYGRRKWIEKSE